MKKELKYDLANPPPTSYNPTTMSTSNRPDYQIAVTGRRMVTKPTRYTLRQRIEIYFRNLGHALIAVPPKEFAQWRFVNPGEEGYDDAPFVEEAIQGFSFGIPDVEWRGLDEKESSPIP